MNLRFRISAASYALMLIMCYFAFVRPFGDSFDGLSLLFCMLILACIALWPEADESNEVDRQLDTKGWADRIEFGANSEPGTRRGA